MIPLPYFLIAWIVLVGIYAIMALLSTYQMLRFGLAGTGTYLSTIIFLAGVLIVIFAASAYLVSIDWTRSVDLFGTVSNSAILTPFP